MKTIIKTIKIALLVIAFSVSLNVTARVDSGPPLLCYPFDPHCGPVEYLK